MSQTAVRVGEPEGAPSQQDAPSGPPQRLRRRPRIASVESWRDRPFRRWAAQAATGDVAAATLAAVLARLGRFGFEDAAAPVGIPYQLIGVVLAVLWPVLLAFSGAYDPKVALFGVEEVRRVARAGVALLASVGVAHFLFALNLSRGYIGVFVPTAIVASAAWRGVLRARTGAEHRRGRGRHRAVAVGPCEEVSRLVARLRGQPGAAIDLVAVVCDDLDPDAPAPAGLHGVERLASRDAIAGLARRSGGQLDLLLRAGRPHTEEMWSLARRSHELGVGLAIAPSRSDASNVAFSYVPLGSTPMMLVETPALKPAHRVAKAVFDRTGAAVALVVLSPLLALIALAVLVRDGRPVLFRQARVGRNGSTFPVLKFRTMTRDAEARLGELSERNEAAGPLFKMRDDPRVTRTGAFLRRYSLDELPQLVNVLTGTMSLVGPRPPLPSEVATYDERTARRLVVKPGLTGLWQIQGRSDLPWDEGVYLDVMYVDHWSPLLDLVILARTARAVLRPRGAY